MIRILVVDDHKIVRDGLRSIFQPVPENPSREHSLSEHHSTSDSIQVAGEAATGKEAIAFLERQAGEDFAVDVVLMDISMPEMNGLEATKYIKAHFPQVKVLLLTMLDKEQFILEASQVGAHGYVLKTAGHKEILRAVRTLHGGEEYFSAEVAKILIRRFQSMAGDQNRKSLPEKSLPERPADVSGTGSSAAAPNSAPLPAGITSREAEVLELIAQGYTTNDIAERLFTSKRTVETHRQNLLTKTKSNNTAALIRFAVQQGLVQ